MYELKKIGKLLTSKSVGTGPKSYEKIKKNSRGRGLTKDEKHCFKGLSVENRVLKKMFGPKRKQGTETWRNWIIGRFMTCTSRQISLR